MAVDIENFVVLQEESDGQIMICLISYRPNKIYELKSEATQR